MPIAEKLAHATVAIDTSGSKEATREILAREWAALAGRLAARAS